jgi:hypothetical protein
MAFALNAYPVTYRAKFSGGKWNEEYLEKKHGTPESEEAMAAEERNSIINSRNCYEDLPLVN